MKKLIPVFIKDFCKNSWANISENIVSKKAKEKIIRDYKKNIPNISYSQEGEDLILQRILEQKPTGFYLDIGAHHPTRFSNTCIFYLKGWRGINIDAMPGSMKLFNELRERDINIEAAISDKKESLVYHSFNEPALNTFSKEEAHAKDGQNGYKIIEKINIHTRLLSDILNEYMPTNKSIDFMNIDVEGLDLNVLRSNDWEKFKPSVIMIEAINLNLENLVENEVYCFLKEKKYTLVAKTHNTLFFKN
jgi:FkbM family methyltransferase